MKKSLPYFILIVLLCILPFIPIFSTPLLPHTSDGGVQLPRMAAYYQSVQDLHLPVRWASTLNFSYGMPLFTFIYHVPFFISTIFLSFGFGLISTFKIVLLLSYILSGIGMYCFAYELWGDKQKACYVSIFYQFAPFRFVELFIRGAIGGIYAYSFLPFVLFGIIKYTKTHAIFWFAFTAVCTALLILSHNSLSLLFFIIILSYIAYCIKPIRLQCAVTISVLIGLALSAWYWVPALWEHKYTYGDLFMKNIYREHFVDIPKLLIPNVWYQNNLLVAEIATSLGLISLLGIIAITLKIKEKIPYEIHRLYIWCLFWIAVSIFFTTKLSNFFWEHSNILRQFQFPWRFLAIIPFASSFGATPLVSLLGKSRYIGPLLCVCVIVSSTYYWIPREGYDHLSENYYRNYPLNTTYFGETDLIWSAGPAQGYAKQNMEIISGDGTISSGQRKTQKHTYTVDAKTDIRVVEHTQYYPGWRAYVDNKKTLVEFQDINWRGQITFAIPKGLHTVRIEFGETPLRIMADIISLITAMILSVGCIKKKPVSHVSV